MDAVGLIIIAVLMFGGTTIANVLGSIADWCGIRWRE